MFPFTHIWFSRNVLGYSNNMTVLGSIFPDVFVSDKLSYEDTHKIGWQIFDYFYDKKPEISEFIKAGATHTVSPEGLDFYGDEKYKGSKGYCFQKASGIVGEVIDACNIPEDYGLWKAHNFIEMAVELNILNENAELIQILDCALKDKKHTDEIESGLETFYQLKPGSLKNSFMRFEHFVYKETISSRILSANYYNHMKNRHGINIDIDKASRIIDKAKHIISEDFDDFISDVEENVKQMLGCRLELL